MFLVHGGGSPVLPDGLNWLSLSWYTRATSLVGTFVSKFDGVLEVKLFSRVRCC